MLVQADVIQRNYSIHPRLQKHKQPHSTLCALPQLLNASLISPKTTANAPSPYPVPPPEARESILQGDNSNPRTWRTRQNPTTTLLSPSRGPLQPPSTQLLERLTQMLLTTLLHHPNPTMVPCPESALALTLPSPVPPPPPKHKPKGLDQPTTQMQLHLCPSA